MKRYLALLGLLISVSYLERPPLMLGRTGEAVTVRGVLSRGGKAGNLWTLTLDQPFQAYNARELDRTQRTVVLRELSFVGGRHGPQDPSLEGKHVELSGNLLLPFGQGGAGVIVKRITVLTDAAKANVTQLQNQLEKVQKSFSGSPGKYLNCTRYRAGGTANFLLGL